ncbi:hypothetical protein HHK36_022753 [Tetracentron sinense]|uniref:Uncharacterized protein n=1 Tax=Tetracentron sinense TaxID=13715 RepID=A0A834YSI2_TETSI|nr:hypothetical protein HHK36_022753 [Tetracentron sinense]
MTSNVEGDGKEPINEQAVANPNGAMRADKNQLYSKITELEMEASEHSLVIGAIQSLDPSRRCYRMIGGMLVERTKLGYENLTVRGRMMAMGRKVQLREFLWVLQVQQNDRTVVVTRNGRLLVNVRWFFIFYGGKWHLEFLFVDQEANYLMSLTVRCRAYPEVDGSHQDSPFSTIGYSLDNSFM